MWVMQSCQRELAIVDFPVEHTGLVAAHMVSSGPAFPWENNVELRRMAHV
jgi:hypothetical protein